MASPTPRIVVTGLGWVTPLGHDIETVWQRMMRGESGVSATTRFDASTFPTTFSAQVKDYDFRSCVKDPAIHEGVGHNTAYALGAAAQAWKLSGLEKLGNSFDRTRLGIYLGSGEGSLDFDNYVAANLAGFDDATQTIQGKAWARAATALMTPVREVEQEPNMPLSHLAMEFDAQGPAYNCLTACAASTQAIGEAMMILQRGDADVMLCGGAHSMIHPLGVTGFNRLTALSTRNSEPTKASRPFSADRGGFVLGEGAGMIVIESLDHAQKRGAHIFAEIAGYGSSADAYRITDMHPEGRGPMASMRQAVRNAGLSIEDIDYIAAHGTGTHENDSTETRAIKNLFGDHAKKLAVSSVKSMFGHLIAAAGAVQLIACCLAMRDQTAPPTINLDNPDPECDLDYIPHKPRKMTINACLSNSFGFGGQNDSLALRRWNT
ncbi:MAG: beta-ketoacyl-ACP synthase II [Phycisphaera sp.]|nr:beta-ketoacyl-ACP synthase II [Phycisphaera sp.]